MIPSPGEDVAPTALIHATRRVRAALVARMITECDVSPDTPSFGVEYARDRAIWEHALGSIAGGGVDALTDLSMTDFAVVVFREDERWEVELLPVALTEDLDGLIRVVRQQPSLAGTIGLVAVGDDFFVAIRILGDDEMVFLSDVTASVDWPLARQVLDYLDIPVPEDEELDQVLPVGDMSIFADLGLDEMELGAVSGDLDLYPDEMLSSIAERVGFAASFDRALDTLG